MKNNRFELLKFAD